MHKPLQGLSYLAVTCSSVSTDTYSGVRFNPALSEPAVFTTGTVQRLNLALNKHAVLNTDVVERLHLCSQIS